MSMLFKRMPIMVMYILAYAFFGIGLTPLYADDATLKPAADAQSKLKDYEYTRYVGLIEQYNNAQSKSSQKLSAKEKYLQENARLSALSSIKYIEKKHSLAYTNEAKKTPKSNRVDARLNKALKQKEIRQDQMEKTKLYLEKLKEKKRADSQH